MTTPKMTPYGSALNSRSPSKNFSFHAFSVSPQALIKGDHILLTDYSVKSTHKILRTFMGHENSPADTQALSWLEKMLNA